MVQLAVRRGDFAEADTWLASAPESARRFALEGDVRVAQRRYADAAAAYDRAFALQPSAGLALRTYATARRAGQPNADAALRSWLERQPNDPDVNFALGSQALEGGDDAAAIARFERAVAANPQHGPSLNNLAWLYDQRGDDKALDFARRAHDVLPNDPAVADTLGWLHVRRGNTSEGLPLLERAAREANNPEIRYHYAVALAETGATADARAILDELVSSTSQFESREEARERLTRLQTQ
jgi:Flp pilus assembly protein TadD